MKLQLQLRQIQPAMKEACFIIDRLLDAGFSAFFVGGAVRDTLLERPIHDIDIATNARPEQVMEVFPSCIPTGLQHGTVTVREGGSSYEVTTFRTESNYTDFRRPADIIFVNDLYEDLRRRDFTMNAMAIDRSWQLHDPFEGLKHVRAGVLKTVGPGEQRFQEDALRMLRAIRFAATYKLTIDQDCWEAIAREAGLLKHIAMERVAYELERLLQSSDPLYGMKLLVDSSLLLHTKEKLHLAKGSLRKAVRMPEAREASMNWVILFYSLKVSSEKAREDMRALRASKQHQIACQHVLQLYEWLVEDPQLAQHSTDEEKLLTLLKEQWLDKLLQYPNSHLVLFINTFLHEFAVIKQIAKLHAELPIHRVKQLAIRGDDLIKWIGKSSGPWINLLLEQIFIEVASCRLANSKEAIYAYVINQVEGGRYDEQS